MNVHEPTLMLALGVASVTASAMFFTLHASARHIAGVRLWASGSLSVGFAVLLDAQRLIETWQIASLLFNIPFGVGQVLFLAGTAQFVGRPYERRTLSMLIAVVVLLTVIFTLAWPDSVLRIFSLSSFEACVNLATGLLLWKHRQTISRRACTAASIVTLAQAGAALAQALLVITSSVTITYAAPQLPIANLITWIGTMLNVLLVNWILFLLVMLRLIREISLVADNDSLTGLLNRRGLRARIDAIMAPNSTVESLGVILLDIDYFKRINDQFGHDTGDRVLVIMGEVMRELAGSNVVPCRWGGEEFCFVVTDFSDRSLIELAEMTRQKFARASKAHPKVLSGATVSAGIARTVLGVDFEFSKLVNLADRQLYLAKNSGRDRICSSF